MAPEDRRGRALRVLVVGEDGRGVRGVALSAWLRRAAPAWVRGEVGIALVRDVRVRALNRQYRKRDYATDVLSFPPDRHERSGGGSVRRRRVGGAARGSRLPYLGEIVIARGVARRQAHAAGHSERTELRILALHGLLHLLGYDHEHERDGGAMARVERALRRRGGLREGLIERAAKP